MSTPLTRTEAEEFLFQEAALLDAWKLEEWANLFTDDGEYLIPATDAPEAGPGTSAQEDSPCGESPLVDSSHDYERRRRQSQRRTHTGVM